MQVGLAAWAAWAACSVPAQHPSSPGAGLVASPGAVVQDRLHPSPALACPRGPALHHVPFLKGASWSTGKVLGSNLSNTDLNSRSGCLAAGLIRTLTLPSTPGVPRVGQNSVSQMVPFPIWEGHRAKAHSSRHQAWEHPPAGRGERPTGELRLCSRGFQQSSGLTYLPPGLAT